MVRDAAPEFEGEIVCERRPGLVAAERLSHSKRERASEHHGRSSSCTEVTHLIHHGPRRPALTRRTGAVAAAQGLTPVANGEVELVEVGERGRAGCIR